MLGMGWVEIFVIVIVALVVIGPDKLPEVARGLAKGIRHIQRLVSEVRDTVNLDEFDMQVRQEMDKNLNVNPNLQNPKHNDSPHPDFKGYDDDIDEDEDPYGPIPKHAEPKKKESSNQ
ncbi:MAG: twin-arginine translocase subunit TatB [Magnetococcales bacterium]|nr:twin-arginine translocase subunit TatB [Magnetococcales bacterium]